MAAKSQSFREVIAWQKTHAFTLEVYRCAHVFPKDELFPPTSQLRRALSSIPSNFVEGFQKRTQPDKLRFHTIAQGSADGCPYQLILAHDRRYADRTALPADPEKPRVFCQDTPTASNAAAPSPSPRG